MSGPQSYTLSEIAASVPGAELAGDGSVTVTDVAHPRMITHPDAAVLILETAALQLLDASPLKPKTAVVGEEVEVPEGLFQAYIRVKRPRVALVPLLALFHQAPYTETGVHPTAVVHESAQLAPGVSVGPHCYVGPGAKIGENTILQHQVTVGDGARLGADCLIFPGVRIGERVVIGNRVILQANAAIGSDGFSYVTPEPGSIESAKASGGKVEAQNTEIWKIESNGIVILEDDVEIGACATVDRANLGATLIRRGTKIDNLVMIGHNNQIGENCMIVSQVGIAGSCQIGDRVVMAGQAGIGDHLKVGDDAIIMAKSGVMRDIAAKEVVVGIPALPRRETLQNVLYTSKLRDLFKEVKDLRKRLAELEKAAGALEQDEARV